MDRFGGRARLTGLGSLGLLLALLVPAAARARARRHSDPPAASKSAPMATAPVKRNLSLPGADVSKPRDGGGDLRRVHFHSRALGRSDSYLIYLPPGYANQAKAGARFPVLYLLHGDGRNERHGAGHLFQRGRVGQAASRLVRSGASRPMLIVMPESTDSSVVGDTEWANTSRGPVRVGRDRPGSICRLDLADGALPQRAGHRRPLDGRLRRGQHRPAAPEHVLGGRELVGLLHADPTGPFAGATPAALRANSPAAYVHTLWSQLTADPIHVLLYISRTDPLRVQQGPFAAALGSLGSRSRRTCSAAPTTSLSGRITCRWRWASPPAGSRAGAGDDVRGADRPGAGAGASLAQGARVSLPAPERRRAAARERPPPAPHPVLDAALALVAGRAAARERPASSSTCRRSRWHRSPWSRHSSPAAWRSRRRWRRAPSIII